MRSLVHITGRKALLFLLFLSGSALAAIAQNDLSDEELDRLFEDDEALERWLEEEFTGWNFSSFARMGWGYSDNILLATVNPQSGDYLRSEVEMFLTRLPDDNGEFYAFLSGTALRYSGVEDADKEQVWLLDSKWRRFLSDTFSGSLRAQYAYFDQILDLSLTERQQTRQRVQYQGYGLGGELEFSPVGSNVYTLETMLKREDFSEILGSDWLGRPCSKSLSEGRFSFF
jgi:hypothetical protein